MALGNGEHVIGQVSSDDTAATLFLRTSDLQLVTGVSAAQGCRMQGLQKLSARFGLRTFACVSGVLMKETMPFRQRGQGIDPDGLTMSLGVVVAEQR